jgi:hypothetical protein
MKKLINISGSGGVAPPFMSSALDGSLAQDRRKLKCMFLVARISPSFYKIDQNEYDLVRNYTTFVQLKQT